MTDAHRCTKFRSERRQSPWQLHGALREREIEALQVCVECSAVRPGRFRKIVAKEREASAPSALQDHALRDLAKKLARFFQDREQLRGGALLRRLGGVRAEAEIERLAAFAPIRLCYRIEQGTWHLHTVQLLDRTALIETAFPGEAARRADAIARSLEDLVAASHPEARRIADLVANADPAWDARTIRCLAALARLVDTGEAMPARAFAAEVLGHSKALIPIRSRLERIVGPLDRLGIRDAGAVVLLGGQGLLRWSEREIDLHGLRYLGISPQEVQRLADVELPSEGVLIVENLTPFHACLDHVGDRVPILLLWSGGFPSRGVVGFIKRVAEKGTRIRVWCDLDLGGVRIARAIQRASAGSAEPMMMDERDVVESPRTIALSPEQREAIQRDVALHPDAFLADTLRAQLARSVWVEQEMMLDRIPAALGDRPNTGSR